MSETSRRRFFGLLLGSAAAATMVPPITAAGSDSDPLVPFCEIEPGQWIHLRQSEIDAIERVANTTVESHGAAIRTLSWAPAYWDKSLVLDFLPPADACGEAQAACPSPSEG